MMLILLNILFSTILIYIGYYLLKHKNKDFMLFKVRSNKSLKFFLNVSGKLLISTGVLCLFLGMTNNVIIITVEMILGISVSTTVCLLLVNFL